MQNEEGAGIAILFHEVLSFHNFAELEFFEK
jgi:hypothetical protein